MAEAWYGAYTGSNLLNQTNVLRIANLEAYTNRIVPVWNGTYITPVTLNPDGSVGFATSEFFADATNGIQFPPFMDGSPVRVYDSRLIQISTFNLGDSAEVGENGLEVD